MIPRFRSSGALSIAPYSRNCAKPFSAWRLVIAAVKVVFSRSAYYFGIELYWHTLPWSTCPIVPSIFNSGSIKIIVRRTNIYMWLVPLKDSGQAPYASAILREHLLNRIHSFPLSKSEFAGPEQRSKRSHKSRHRERHSRTAKKYKSRPKREEGLSSQIECVRGSMVIEISLA